MKVLVFLMFILLGGVKSISAQINEEGYIYAADPSVHEYIPVYEYGEELVLKLELSYVITPDDGRYDAYDGVFFKIRTDLSRYGKRAQLLDGVYVEMIADNAIKVRYTRRYEFDSITIQKFSDGYRIKSYVHNWEPNNIYNALDSAVYALGLNPVVQLTLIGLEAETPSYRILSLNTPIDVGYQLEVEYATSTGPRIEKIPINGDVITFPVLGNEARFSLVDQFGNQFNVLK
jgi:hypothetical protein